MDFIIDQYYYIRKLECLPLEASLQKFSSMRMKLEWLSRSRHDCFFKIAQMEQVTEYMFNKQPVTYIRRLNKAIPYATDKQTQLKIIKLDKKTLKIASFSDASFANNHDLSLQLRYIVLFVDARFTVVRISFRF